MAEAPDPTRTLSPPLADLIQSGPDRWSLPRLWAAMPLPLRQEAVATVLASDEGPLRAELLSTLARSAGFRAETFGRMAPEQVARYAGRLPSRKLPFPADLFPSFLVAARPELLSAYLDAAGIPNQNGQVEEGWEEKLDPEGAASAAEGLLGSGFPPDDVAVYLAALSLLNASLAPGIPAWLQERFPSGRPSGASAPDGPAPDAADEGDAPEPGIIQEARDETRDEALVPGDPFTPLDRTLIRVAVDSAQGVAGAPDALTVDDMVEELLALNGSRHSSFFHRGFVDALQGKEWRSELPGTNEDRRRWYAAGWLSGEARRGAHGAIVARFRDDPALQALNAKTDGPALLSLPILFEALCHVGEEPEAVRMVPAEYLLRNPLPLPRLLEHGTHLLRSDELERARPIFDRLGEVVALLEDQGEDTTEPFFLEVRRRRAHCYRQSGDAARARELLERLLDEDPDPDVRARVLADLGLLDAGLRSLAEVRLWRTDDERPDVLEGLERGRERFQASLDTPSPYAAHGAWPLAVLAMGREAWDEARDLLSRARSQFLRQRSRYDQGNLLARVTLAAGIAEALTLDLNRLPRARELLLEGTEGGARIPRSMLRDVLGALEEAHEDLDREVLKAVLDLEGPEVLDFLRDSPTVERTPAVAFLLLERARDPSVKGSVRVRDLHTALPILLSAPASGEGEGAGAADLRDEAGRALDLMEELAHQGVGQDEFLELLRSPEQVDPAWSREDAVWARIHLLENRGEYEEAAVALRQVLEWVLAGTGAFAHEDPEGVVARAKAYRVSAKVTGEMEARLAGWKREREDEDELPPLSFAHPNQQLRVLIVGGDERRHQLEGRVQAKLDEEGVPVRVSHLPTGWSGNWAGTLEAALAQAERHDALVLIRYMRTEFGKSLRRGIEQPWVSCPGVGVGQVVRRVRKVAGMVGGPA